MFAVALRYSFGVFPSNLNVLNFCRCIAELDNLIDYFSVALDL